MEKERKFRFVGNPKDYKEPKLEVNAIYKGSQIFKHLVENVEWHSETYPEDWEEVTEQDVDSRQFDYTNISTGILPRIPNQYQPASSMTKFEMAVFMAMQGMISRSNPNEGWSEGHSSQCIHIAKETFKQLDELK